MNNIRNNYGPGQKESVYHNLLGEELDALGLFYEKEKSIRIYSSRTKRVIGYYRPDYVVEGKIIIEIKSSRVATRQDEKQLYHYLRNSKYEIGYLVNFSTHRIYIKRIIYSNNRKPFLNKSFSNSAG